MMQVNEKFESVEFDHKLWSMELMAMQNEIELYIERIRRLLESTKDEDDCKELTDLLNAMIQEKQVTEKLLQDIKTHDADIKQVIHAGGEISTVTAHSHGCTRKAMGIARVDFADLQERFHLYSAGEG